MTLRIGVVMDPIQSIHVKKDSTLAMLLAAQSRGWQLYYMEMQDLFSENGQAYGTMATLQVKDNSDNWFQLSAKATEPLASLDVILMRKDPPFDREYIYSTYILEQAEQQGTLIVNKPQSLRDCNEKFFATQFPQCCPPVLVSRSNQLLKKFQQQHKDVIYKPLDGMGGASIFRVRENDPNLNVIIETLSQQNQQQVMAQKFIPEISQGDKRIILINGKPVPYCLARIPTKGETRGNLAAGGRGEGRALSTREHWICEQIAPLLIEKGLLFVGIDVIGDYLTEINVTSPTCIRELDTLYNLDIAGQLMDCIENQLLSR